jgi:hypothetical protein
MGGDPPIALSSLLLATSAVCGAFGGDHSRRPAAIEPSLLRKCCDGVHLCLVHSPHMLHTPRHTSTRATASVVVLSVRSETPCVHRPRASRNTHIELVAFLIYHDYDLITGALAELSVQANQHRAAPTQAMKSQPRRVSNRV